MQQYDFYNRDMQNTQIISNREPEETHLGRAISEVRQG